MGLLLTKLYGLFFSNRALKEAEGEIVMKEKDEPKPRHDENQFLDLLVKILKDGHQKSDRTGTGTLSIFGTQSRYSLADGTFPLLTTKKMFLKGIVEELLWLVRGSTSAKELQDKGVRIWDGNSSRAFLDSHGLSHRAEGDLGPIYGFQWRHFGADYVDFNTDYTGQGYDQLRNVIELIKNNPDDRRILMSAWNPVDLKKMALPPCHILAQFYVENGQLSCHMYQRSADMGLGVPFNIASYSLLTIMIAHVCNLKPKEFIHSTGDTHIYINHIEPLNTQIERTPRPFPKLNILRKVTDIEDFKFEDFELLDYCPWEPLRLAMAV